MWQNYKVTKERYPNLNTKKCNACTQTYLYIHGRATSGPRARSGPRRPSVRPATLRGNNMAIRPANPSQKMPVSWLRVAHTQYTLHHSQRGCVCQVCQPRWRHVCCGEGRQLHPLPQLESPPVPDTGWRGRRAICSTFAKFAGRVEDPCLLSRVCDLQKEIATFLRQKNLPYADQFFDPLWLARLALLTDIITKPNALNVKLQGKDILVTDKHAHITAFEVKQRLWEVQLAAACVPDDVKTDTCVSVVASVSKEFASRFAGVRPLSADFKLFTAPLTFPWMTPLPVYRPFDFTVDDAPAPSDGVGRATVQCWTEGEVLQLFSTVLLPRHRPPF